MIKGNYGKKSSIQKDDLKITNVHTPNNRASKCVKGNQQDKRKRKKNPQLQLEILTPCISIWKKTRQKDH